MMTLLWLRLKLPNSDSNLTRKSVKSRVNRQQNCSFHEAFGGFQFTDLDNLFML